MASTSPALYIFFLLEEFAVSIETPPSPSLVVVLFSLLELFRTRNESYMISNERKKKRKL